MIISCFVLLFAWNSPALAQTAIDIVYPKEGDLVTATDSTFIFGSVTGTNVRLLVQGTPVRVHPAGTFLAYVPVSRGEFTFELTAITGSDSVTAVRNVLIPPWPAPIAADSLVIDTTSLQPRHDLEVMTGDLVNVAFRGTPGMSAAFSIPGLLESTPMVELNPSSEAYWGEAVFGLGRTYLAPARTGFYQGVFPVSDLAAGTGRVMFELSDADGSQRTATAPGKLSAGDNSVPRVARLLGKTNVTRTAPGLAYDLFLPRGVKLAITGKNGDYYRARLSDTAVTWIQSRLLEFLPVGTPMPVGKVSVVRTQNRGSSTAIRIHLQEKLPFRVEQLPDPAQLLVTIFGATSDTDWIKYDFSDDFIKQVSWSQPARGVYQLTVAIDGKQQWGFSPYYDGNVLVVDVRKPPAELRLKGLVVCVDPGHGPADGAVGPSRMLERDATLRLALVLKEKLEKKGATVFLTRKEQHGAGLLVRTDMARYLEADLFLSLHFNALPDGVNPFMSRGTSTYYYHPQSRPLAAAIQRQMLKKLKLSNFGLYYDNLAVCRITQMPSVLIEPAFMMHPEEEALIGTEKFQKETAAAIVKGVEEFLKSAKE